MGKSQAKGCETCSLFLLPTWYAADRISPDAVDTASRTSSFQSHAVV